MYILKFKENKSKNFPLALEMAKEFNCEFKNGIVTIEIEDILNAYSQIRTLFSWIQNWKGTSATFRGKPVHPYQFLLHVHWIGDCYDSRQIDKNCGAGWECLQLAPIKYHITGPYFKTHKYWYNYGRWEEKQWVVDKQKILAVLLDYVEKKGIDACPFFDQFKLKHRVQNLPSYLIADGIVFETVYEERFLAGERMQIPCNIKHRYPDKIKGKTFCLLDF